MEALRGLWSVFTAADESATTTAATANTATDVQDAPMAPPHAGQAFAQLQSNPAQFMRRNRFRVTGNTKVESGPNANFVFVSEGNQGRTRTNIIGDTVGVNEFRIMPRERYNMFSGTLPNHHPHFFKASHIRMEKAAPGTGHTTIPRATGVATSATIPPGKKETFITHALNGCSMIRKKREMLHIQPAGGGATNQFGLGLALEQQANAIDPTSDVWGVSQYNSSSSAGLVHPFIQSTRRGSVHIYAQQESTTGMSGEGTDWQANLQHRRMAPQPLTTNFASASAALQQHHQSAQFTQSRQRAQFDQQLSTQMAQTRAKVGNFTPAPADPADDWSV
jgi:hypothetical protein